MDFEGFYKKCKSVADQLVAEPRIAVVGHYDADGLAATAILVKALRRAGVETDFINTRQIDQEHLDEVNSLESPTVCFVDMGSGQIEFLEKEVKKKFFIIDHHPPVKETPNQVNPFQHGINGTRELSATGAVYFVAKAMDEQNMDMAPIGIVGAVGDMQDLRGGLKGANRKIIEDAEKLGIVDAHKDLALFGRQSRMLPKMLEYCSYPMLYGLTGNYIASVKFIEQLGIPLKDPIGGEPRHYVDLTLEEKQKFTTALHMLLMDHNAPHMVTDMLISEVYEFPKEKKGCELRDAKEFATVLNACLIPGTQIMGLDGSIKEIENFEDNLTSNMPFSLNLENGLVHANAPKKIHKVKLPKTMRVYDITTNNGLTLSATENHEFLTASRDGVSWKSAEDVSPEDYLALPREIKTSCSHYSYNTSDLFSEGVLVKKQGKFRLKKCKNFINDTPISEDFFELTGFILGDGHIAKNYIDIVFGKDERSKELELHYINLISKLFGLEKATHDEKDGYKNIIWNNKTLSTVFQKMGIPPGNKTRTLNIPQKMLVAPNDRIAALLRGLMESDGNVYHGGLEFSTHSKPLAEQLPLVFLRFGIKTHLVKKKCHDCHDTKYVLLICGYDDVLNYSNKIGFTSSSRKQWITDWLNTRRRDKSNTDLLPFASKSLCQLHAELGLPTKWSSHFTYYKSDKAPRRKQVAKYLVYFEQRLVDCDDALETRDLKKVISVLNISLTQFANSAGISREWLARILKGKKPGKNAAKKIKVGRDIQRKRIKETRLIFNDLKLLTNSEICWDSIKSISSGKKTEYVYDLTIPKDHNYFANGILVHNCGRHEEGEVGVQVCMGDRKAAWNRAKLLLEKHRRELREGIEWVKNNGIQEMDHLYYFDGSGVIRETLVGIIAGMAYGAMPVKMSKPIIAFGMTDEGEMKISGRGNYDLVRAGLKLGVGLNEATEPLGGGGGGHDVAAGAKIPPEKKEEFLKAMDAIVAKQLGK